MVTAGMVQMISSGLFLVFGLSGLQAADPPEPGVWTERIVVGERSALSAMDVVEKRLRLGARQKLEDYDLGEESFQVYIPAAAEGDLPRGVFVWVNALPSGVVAPGWKAVFDRANLIVIGANRSGNGRGVGTRMGLAVDAAFFAVKELGADPRRVYVGGPSGGRAHFQHARDSLRGCL